VGFEDRGKRVKIVREPAKADPVIEPDTTPVETPEPVKVGA
jgi:hypothetical protein